MSYQIDLGGCMPWLIIYDMLCTMHVSVAAWCSCVTPQ